MTYMSHQLGGSSGLGALAAKNEDRSSEPRTYGNLGVVPPHGHNSSIENRDTRTWGLLVSRLAKKWELQG